VTWLFNAVSIALLACSGLIFPAASAGNGNASVRGWGGGMDFTYWFPWRYAGVRFQGTGMSIQSSGFTTTVQPFANLPARTINVPSGNIAAGVLVGDALLRLPLDDYWPCFHLAPYVFGGFGGILVGSFGSARQLVDAIMQYLAQNLFASFCFFSHDASGARRRENR
jgi:hypothetical protein